MKNQWVRRFRTIFAITTLGVFLGANAIASDGEVIFKQNCASCHKVFKESTGPALRGAKQRWEDAGEGAFLYDWVKDNAALIKSGKSKRAIEMEKVKPTAMTAFPGLSNEDIDAVFTYVDGLSEPSNEVAVNNADPNGGGKESDLTFWLIVFISVFGVVAITGLGVKRKLAYVANEREEDVYKPFGERAREWIIRNWQLSLILFLVIAVSTGVDLMRRGMDVAVFEDYQPSQPIAYSHKLHAGDMGIDCKYCHNSAEKSKHAGIPTTNVCMNCHRMVLEGKTSGTNEIAKIHEAVGFNAEKGVYNTDAKGNVKEGAPIVWNKAHNLPDHVFFSHAQHVNPNSGNIDCRQCHGPVEHYTLGRVSTIGEINAYAATKEGKEKGIIPLTKQLLTMGWCIECHQNKSVDLDKNDYYREIHSRLKNHPASYKDIKEDGEVTAMELGGWECGKCHY